MPGSRMSHALDAQLPAITKQLCAATHLLVANVRHLWDRLRGMSVAGSSSARRSELAELSGATSTWKAVAERAAGYRPRLEVAAAPA